MFCLQWVQVCVDLCSYLAPNYNTCVPRDLSDPTSVMSKGMTDPTCNVSRVLSDPTLVFPGFCLILPLSCPRV